MLNFGYISLEIHDEFYFRNTPTIPEVGVIFIPANCMSVVRAFSQKQYFYRKWNSEDSRTNKLVIINNAKKEGSQMKLFENKSCIHWLIFRINWLDKLDLILIKLLYLSIRINIAVKQIPYVNLLIYKELLFVRKPMTNWKSNY